MIIDIILIAICFTVAGICSYLAKKYPNGGLEGWQRVAFLLFLFAILGTWIFNHRDIWWR